MKTTLLNHVKNIILNHVEKFKENFLLTQPHNFVYS